MKKILMLLVPLLAFIGGAVGGDIVNPSKGAKTAATSPGHETPPGNGQTDSHDAHGEAAAEGHDAGNSDHASAESHATSGDHGEGTAGAGGLDWFKFPNQFFVPILRNGSATATMILSLTIEMPAASRAEIEGQEHRLRDALLNALLIQANTGGFDGNFTAEPTLERLRNALLVAAQGAAGQNVKRILIEDIARQDS